jgi:hypothetical protein
VRALVHRFADRAPTLAFAHLDHPAVVGERYGFHSRQYADAVTRVSGQIARIRKAIRATPALRDNTLLVVTADSGGAGRSTSHAARPDDYRIPFLAVGPSVPAGRSLYALNPQLHRPGARRVGYNTRQPVRNGFVANLVTLALGLPRVPSSTLDPDQSFTVFDPSP